MLWNHLIIRDDLKVDFAQIMTIGHPTYTFRSFWCTVAQSSIRDGTRWLWIVQSANTKIQMATGFVRAAVHPSIRSVSRAAMLIALLRSFAAGADQRL